MSRRFIELVVSYLIWYSVAIFRFYWFTDIEISEHHEHYSFRAHLPLRMWRIMFHVKSIAQKQKTKTKETKEKQKNKIISNFNLVILLVCIQFFFLLFFLFLDDGYGFTIVNGFFFFIAQQKSCFDTALRNYETKYDICISLSRCWMQLHIIFYFFFFIYFSTW